MDFYSLAFVVTIFGIVTFTVYCSEIKFSVKGNISQLNYFKNIFYPNSYTLLFIWSREL